MSSWLDDPSVLLRQWTQLIPNDTMSPTDRANAVARLGVVGGIGLTLAFGSPIFIGAGLLLILLSRQMILKNRASNTATTTTTQVATENRLNTDSQATTTIVMPAGAVSASRRRRKKSQDKRPDKRGFEGAPSAPSWAEFFQGPSTPSSAMGAYVSMTGAAAGQPEIGQVMPDGGPADPTDQFQDQLVPMDAVEEFQAGGQILRTPFPRPITATDLPAGPARSGSVIVRDAQGNVISDLAAAGPFAASAPFQSGFPTQFGPAPTAIPPSGGQFVRSSPNGADNIYALQAAQQNVGSFQPTQPTTWGAFMSDGGATSSPLVPPVPSGTAGSDFQTAEYVPRHLAEAPAQMGQLGHLSRPGPECFLPNQENPLGNPPIEANFVARPKLCPPQNPHDDSTKFVDQLYLDTGAQEAGYQFFPRFHQDIVQDRDNFQKWVLESGQTHFKDRYTYGEAAGQYNIVDLQSELGF